MTISRWTVWQRSDNRPRTLATDTAFCAYISYLRPISQILVDQPYLDVDLAFIDGEHYGEQPLLDYRATNSHLAPAGCIVFHDVQSKYNVDKAVFAAESDGFVCVPLNTSCEMVVATRTPDQHSAVSLALSLAQRGLLIDTEQ